MKNDFVRNALLASAGGCMLIAAPAIAHHGTSAHFDHDKEINVVGVVSEMKFVNPHSYLYFDVLSDAGEVVPWRCEMVEAGTLRRAGVTDEILAPGTIVHVNGKPARREDAVCYLETMTLTDGTTISHRGQMAAGTESFTPSDALKALTVTSSSEDTPILATGGSDAASRKIVPVPTEGFFGYWSDGTRNSLAANTGNRVRGQGNGAQAQRGSNAAMATRAEGGGGNGAMAGGGMAGRTAAAEGDNTARAAGGGNGAMAGGGMAGRTATAEGDNTARAAGGGRTAANGAMAARAAGGGNGAMAARAAGGGNGAMAGGMAGRTATAEAEGGTTARAMGGRTMANGGGSRNPNVQYNAEGQAMEARYDARYDNPALSCSASVLFGMGHHSLSNEFVKLSEKELRLTYGYMDMVRTIHVDGDFPRTLTPSVSGYSVGNWEDDTLVVTTKGFLPGVLFAYAGSGDGSSTLNSERLEVTERFTYDAAADTLGLKWTATDPGYWTSPLSGERTLNRSIPYEVYGCLELAGENNIRENGESLFMTSADPTSGVSGQAAPAGQDKSPIKAILIAAALLLLLGGLAIAFFAKSAKRQE